MRANAASRFSVTLASLLAAVATAATAVQSFPLPDHGHLLLIVPKGWESEVRQSSGKSPPTISLTPATGADFKLLLTPRIPVSQKSGASELAQLRTIVEAAAKAAERQSVERL